MTKFIKFDSKKSIDGKKSTVFTHQVYGNPPKIEEAEYTPSEFNNVVHLYYDSGVSSDIFVAWNEDMEDAWTFFGIKGDEFD